MLRAHAAAVGRASNFTIYDEDDNIGLIKRVMEGAGISTKAWSAKAISSLISDAVPPISVARPVHASLGGTKTTLAVPSAFQKKNSLSSSQLPKSKSSSLLKLSGGVDKVIGDATPRLDGNYLKGLAC